MTNKVLVIALAAIIIASGVGVAVLSGAFNTDEDYKISIVDGSGKTIKLKEPLTGIITGNTNVPKACNILGLNDLVKGLSFYSSSSDSSNWDRFSSLFPNAKHMSPEKTLTAEEILPVAEAIIVPVNSMTVSTAQEKSYNEMGITVIRLDCYGDTMRDDMNKLTILFGEKEDTLQNFNNYWNMFDSVKNTVISKVKEVGGLDEMRFLYFYGSMDAFYNQTSESSDLVESIAGKNALREIDNLDLTKISNDAEQLGLYEKIIALDDANPIDYLFIRGSTTTVTTDDAVALFKDSELFKSYSDLSVFDTDKTYMFNSELMSGGLSYMAYVIIAEILGVDTGYNTTEMIEQFNEKYKVDEPTTGIAFHIVVSGSVVTATELSYT
ncbi:MAG: hypothetical protein J5813_03590 [Candidatus Methanomethylophilaceae archaeon]|nr:hypothetical protein [Candidatus Methanomethylophilaceae archaeon]